uniref:Lysozyme n=1 Tax=Meloidogyne incognita TaxID=6306 RepID=A0A914M535_MELIC
MNILIISPLFVFFCLSSLYYSVEATEGVCIRSEWHRVPTYKCLQDILSAKFVVTGALREDGLIDNNADINIIFARAAGFVDIDIYFYPCATCISPMLDTLKYLEDYYAKFNRVWLCIWGVTDAKNPEGWTSNKAENVNYIAKMVYTLKAENYNFGIYTSRDNWIAITGNTTEFSDAPLLYYNYDNKNNFDDFYRNPFGGWKTPTMKLYTYYKKVCGAEVWSLWKP